MINKYKKNENTKNLQKDEKNVTSPTSSFPGFKENKNIWAGTSSRPEMPKKLWY